MNLRLRLAALTVMAATQTIGCWCGVGPSAGPNIQNGVVAFDSVKVGSSEQLTIPFQDSNPNAGETITGATITGPDAAAFEVISTFPAGFAAGGQVPLELRFAPTHAGSSSATLVLETQAMGPSQVQLEGTGVGAGG